MESFLPICKAFLAFATADECLLLGSVGRKSSVWARLIGPSVKVYAFALNQHCQAAESSLKCAETLEPKVSRLVICCIFNI
jgi:hypothetical protein